MSNLDETLIDIENDMKTAEEESHTDDAVQKEVDTQSIYDTHITVYGMPIQFAERSVLQERAKIYMPKDFEELSAEEIELLYPLGNRPQIVFGNSYFDFTIGFNHTDHKMPDTMMVEFAKVVKTLLEKAGPKVRIFKEDAFEVNETQFSSLEFTSHTLTDVVYNMMFFTSLEEKVLIGFINFNSKNLKRHKAIAMEVIKSFCFMKGE